MTTREFSDMFDTLLNSYNSQAMFGEGAAKEDIVLDEYEKSVLLTNAQDIIVKSYFDRTLNPQAQGFDDTTRRQTDFSSLISVEKAQTATGTPYDTRGKLFKMPANLLVALNEKIEIKDNQSKVKGTSVVVPINYKEYDRHMSKAYTQPLKKQAWRLFQSAADAQGNPGIVSEIIPVEWTIGTGDTIEYKIRYIRRPRPIVLQNFSEDSADSVGIDGISTKTECELNPILHADILNKAVELALMYKGRGGGASGQPTTQSNRSN